MYIYIYICIFLTRAHTHAHTHPRLSPLSLAGLQGPLLYERGFLRRWRDPIRKSARQDNRKVRQYSPLSTRRRWKKGINLPACEGQSLSWISSPLYNNKTVGKIKKMSIFNLFLGLRNAIYTFKHSFSKPLNTVPADLNVSSYLFLTRFHTLH